MALGVREIIEDIGINPNFQQIRANPEDISQDSRRGFEQCSTSKQPTMCENQPLKRSQDKPGSKLSQSNIELESTRVFE